jgi:N-acetylmuramoyl-L-alanine amidase
VIRTRLAHDLMVAPNVEPRRNGAKIDMLVLHYTGMESAPAALRQLCSATSGVSCHYLVNEDGNITQMVGEEMRAWHAGVSFWRGESDTNSRSIGIEIHNPGHGLGYPDFPDRQMESVVRLCRDVISRHGIPARHVLAHSDVAPGRKIDPGEKFDWRRMHEEGVGVWVPAPEIDEVMLDREDLMEFLQLLSAFGYQVEGTTINDEKTRKVVDAFQRHFRSQLVNGLADRCCLDTLQHLIASLVA